MGSYEQAYVSGFLCRLCSEMHKVVIHIYGAEGQSIGLADKINQFLPITITPHDPLPKTVCRYCLRRVQDHHVLIKTIAQSNSKFSAAIRAAAIARLTTGTNSRRTLATVNFRQQNQPSSSNSTETSSNSSSSNSINNNNNTNDSNVNNTNDSNVVNGINNLANNNNRLSLSTDNVNDTEQDEI